MRQSLPDATVLDIVTTEADTPLSRTVTGGSIARWYDSRERGLIPTYDGVSGGAAACCLAAAHAVIPVPVSGTPHHVTNRSRPNAEDRVTGAGPLVSVVDDDQSVRESLPDLLKELGFAVRAFASGEEFLASDDLLGTKCLILDIAMPGMSGPDVHRELGVRRLAIPIIFITAHGDDGLRPQLMEQGAVAVLLKPFSEAALLAAINAALRID